MPGEVKKYVRYYVESRKKWLADKVKKPRPIILSFHYDAKILCTTTGMKVFSADWDDKKQRVKPSVRRSSEVNQILDQLEQKINDVYFSTIAQGIEVNNDILLRGIKKDKTTDRLSFWEEWERYFEIHKNKHGKGTLKSMKTSYHRFKEFMKGRNVKFEEINPELLSRYNEFLLKVGNTNNTIHGNIKRLKIFLNYAKKLGMHKNDSYRQYTVSERVGSIKFLEWEEVKTIMDVQLDSQMEADARDLFCFCCLTAMRYSDVSQLRHTDIKQHTFKDIDGVHYAAHIRQQKTDKVTVIPLMKEALEILERHKNRHKEFALPQRELQSVNRTIKDVAKLAGISSKQEKIVYRGNEREVSVHDKSDILSTHWARRTFVTIAATRGMPINVVASITGQNPKTTLKHYMGVIDSKKFEEVQKKLQF